MSSPTSSLITIVRAGAGAGKTTSLVHQVQTYFHHFVKAHKRSPRLIVTTFTRKATQELRERLLRKASSEKDWAFVEYLQSSDLFVTTIHGVLNSFLKKVSHLTGQDPSFQIIGDQESHRIARRIMQKMVKDGLISTEWLSRYDFSRSQEMVMQFVDSRAFRWPAINEAAYIEELFLYKDQLLIELKVSIDNIQFESEVFSQYQKEILNFIDQWPDEIDLWSEYFESLPKKPRASKTTGTDGDKTEDSQNAIKKLKKFFEDEWTKEKEIQKVIHEWQEFDRWARIFHESFRAEKQSHSLLSMQDLESLSSEILSNQPELCSYFASDWDYWLIDEFQDTSPVQMEILEKLTEGKPCYLVGDPQQSIYLFRGAKAEIFHKEWEAKDRQRVELNTNYRSRPSLIHLAADIFDSPMVPSRQPAEDENLKTPIKIVVYPKDQESSSESHSDDSDSTSSFEARAVVKELIERKEMGAAWSQMAILARTHQQLYNLSLELKKQSIPFVLSGGQVFWDRREIRDVVQFLKFLINPHDNLNLMSLLRSPWMADADQLVPHQTLTAWIHEARDPSYWQHFQKQSHPVIELLKNYSERAKIENLISLAEEFAAEKGLLDSIIQLDSTGQKEGQVWKLLTWLRQQERLPGWQILKALQQVDESLLGDPGSAREVEAVQMMTIHASKGLEFDHVYLLSVSKAPALTLHKSFSADEDEGFWSFPVYSAQDEKHLSTRFCRKHREHLRDRERAEFKRLFYVATTRAKETLTMLTSSDIKNDSWLAMLPIQRPLEEGTIQRQAYQIKIENFDVLAPETKYVEQKTWSKEVRPLWRTEHAPQYKKAMAVTKLIEPSFQAELTAEALVKKNRGTQVHKLFEVLKYHSWKGAEAWAASQPASGGATKNEFKKALKYIQSLKEIPMEEILEQGHSEWPFQVSMDGQWIEGQIDLWAEVGGVIWIIDYKTGSKKNVDSAWKQLSWYGKALNEMGYKGPQKHVVLYPLEEACVVNDFDLRESRTNEHRINL